MALRRLISLAFIASSAAACSPYSFSKEVGAMNDGVGKLSDAIGAGYDGLAADNAARTKLALLDTHATTPGSAIGVPVVCNKPTETEETKLLVCDLFLKGTPEPTVTRIEQSRAETMDAVTKLKNYAGALAAVTNAADRSAYDNAVSQLSGSVGAITMPFNAAAPGVSALAGATVNIVGWLFGTALDEQRYDSLKKAVTIVGNPVATTENPHPKSHIRAVTTTLGKGLLLLKEARITALNAQAGALVLGLNTRRFSAEDYQKRFEDAQSVLAVISGLRQSDPTSAANDLADAHDKLVLAVADPTHNYTKLLNAIAEFTDKVSAVHSAMTAMSKSTARKGS